MVAVIHNSSNLRNALHYNENKVKQGVAKFIHAGNYPKDTELLGFSDKINRLEKQSALNQQTKVNSVHISLNFDTADKLNTEKLKQIVDTYMRKIGFSEQPYLVYEHNDAGHPHIHIVTTNIKHDGKRISLHNLGRNQSEKARKEIEKNFQLIHAENKQQVNYQLKPVNAQKVLYGKAETKRAITNVLDHVLPLYKYASLAELNAVLQQYNIVADRGSESSRIYQTKGLVYRILDANKQKVGVPIKASLIYSKPTLKNIEVNFEKNKAEKQRHKQRVANAIDLTLLKRRSQSLQEFMTAVQKENIHVMLRQNNNGVIYGITYVDHRTKCVFNGSDLGKLYSATAILQRCNAEQKINDSFDAIKRTQHDEKTNEVLPEKQYRNAQFATHENDDALAFAKPSLQLFDDLLQPEENRNSNEPFEQRGFKKKIKRKQQQSHD